MTARPVVTFAMEWVPQYRAPFYERLRVELDRRGIEMRLVHGDPPGSRKARNDARVIDWATYRPNRVWTVAGLELTAQPVVGDLRGSDLIVAQQETGLLLNYGLLAWSRLRGPMLGLWGHGHNFNPLEASGPAEAVKRRVTRFADWAFAYTLRSAEVFRSIGFDPTRITVVQNSLDIDPIRNPVGEVSADVAELVAKLRADGARVAWIVSALDRWKRVPFLIEVLDECRAREPDFAFVALGAGDEQPLLLDAARTRPWLHPLGARFGPDKAAIGEIAELTIQPGLAGLHVVETFATETPMVTADIDYHSHEISYLDADNSVLLPATATAADFGTAVADLLGDPERLAGLKAGCARSADVYDLDAMVGNFADGIEAALAARRG